MNELNVFEQVRDAVIWAKSELVTLAPAQVAMTSVLSEPPIYIDSIEFVAMVTRLEDVFQLVADDDHFSPGTMRTVGDVVLGVQRWIADSGA